MGKKRADSQQVVPMPSADLRELMLLPCPCCGDLAPLWANFCGMCAYPHNLPGYFDWLANKNAK